MDFPALRTFVKVVQAGSFTRAAAALETQKAQVSRVVSQLERELGVRLLERTTRALSLTEIGREFFAHALGILASAEEARRVVQASQGEPRGTLKLTCGVEFGMMAVNRWIHRYLQRYPTMAIESDFTGRIVDIVHEGFDLAIRLGSLADSTLTARRLGELRYGLFASRDYLAQRGTPVQPADLASHDVLAFVAGSHQAVWTLSQAAQQERVVLHPRLRANNVFAVRDAAVAGLGVAQLPLLVAASAVADRQLLAVLPDWSPPRVAVHAVYASARFLTPKVRSFIDLAAADMSAPAALAERPEGKVPG